MININHKIVRKVSPYLLILQVSLLSSFKVQASHGDTVLNGLRLEAKAIYGFIYPHSSFMEYILERNIYGYEVLLSTASNGRHKYEYLYRFPRYGAGYTFSNFGNKEVLGVAHALFGFCEVPFYLSKNRISANYKLDFGLAYNSVVYDVYDNPLNHSISSHINGFVGFDINAVCKIANNNFIKLGFELSHYSNGKMKSPNLGINIVTLTGAYIYSLVPARRVVEKPFKHNAKTKHLIDLVYNYGRKRDDMFNDKRYFISTLVGDYYYCFVPKYGVGGGIDFFYDESLAPTKEYEDDVEATYKDNYQFGAHLGAVVRYRNFGVHLGAGQYIYAPYHKYSSFYSRFGMRYAIKGKVILNFTVKAHYAIADYLEWGIGYRFEI